MRCRRRSTRSDSSRRPPCRGAHVRELVGARRRPRAARRAQQTRAPPAVAARSSHARRQARRLGYLRVTSAASSAWRSACDAARPSTSPSTATTPPRGTCVASQSMWWPAVPVGIFTRSMPLHSCAAPRPASSSGCSANLARPCRRLDDQRAPSRPVKPEVLLAALPAAGQVFGQVRIARRHQHGIDAALVHHLAQAGDTGAGRRGAGVHRLSFAIGGTAHGRTPSS